MTGEQTKPSDFVISEGLEPEETQFLREYLQDEAAGGFQKVVEHQKR